MKSQKHKALSSASEPRPKITLRYLLGNVAPENLHSETDWGPPVGKERWWE